MTTMDIPRDTYQLISNCIYIKKYIPGSNLLIEMKKVVITEDKDINVGHMNY